MRIPCNFSSRGYWCSKNFKDQGVFVPEYKRNPVFHGIRYNPIGFQSRTTWSARIFVGFNIGLRQGFTLKNLIALVRRVRIEQTGLPNSTFLTQKGIYTYTSGKYAGKFTQEKGAQVIILNVPPTQVSKKDFEAQMQKLAEIIAKKFTQEQVVLEIQKNGQVQMTYGMIP